MTTDRSFITALHRTQSGATRQYGGIKINMANNAGYLEVAHFLIDDTGGFSALMKVFDYDPTTTFASRSFGGVKEWTTRAPMLALTDPDPALGFPAGTKLQPLVFVRNASNKAVTAHLRFNWSSATLSGKTAPINLSLRPDETQLVDVGKLQVQKFVPPDAHWVAVVLSAPVEPDELMAVAASYDQSGRYGAQTPFNDQLAADWEAGKWEVDSMHDSLVTVANGGSKPARAQITIFFNRGAGQYQLEQDLTPDGQMLVDFGKLIHDQIPDKAGHILPPDISEGSYRVRDLTDRALGSLYEGKLIVDKTYGSASYGCAQCCGFNQPFMEWNPLGVPVGSFTNQQVMAQSACIASVVEDITSSMTSWSTNNTAIATAQAGGRINGISAGSTNHLASGSLLLGNNHAINHTCPMSFVSPAAGTNVHPMVSIQGNLGYVYIGHDPQVTQHINALFASGVPSGGTYTWSSSDANVSFDNSAAATVHVTATTYSGGTNDTKIAVDYLLGGQSAPQASVFVTKRLFFYLTGDSLINLSTFSGPTQYGYIFQANYNVFTHPDHGQVTDGDGVATSENVTQISSNVPVAPKIGQGALNANSQLVDNPIELLSSAPLPSILKIVDSQDLVVGGFFVRNNTMTFSSTGVTISSNGPAN